MKEPMIQRVPHLKDQIPSPAPLCPIADVAPGWGTVPLGVRRSLGVGGVCCVL